MRIDLSGHHIEITDGIRANVEKKLKKLNRQHEALSHINVILDVDKNQQGVEASTQYLGKTISVSAKDSDLYKAIDQVSNKLGSALATRKGHVNSNMRVKMEVESSADELEEA